jgi:hypothetical protein
MILAVLSVVSPGIGSLLGGFVFMIGNNTVFWNPLFAGMIALDTGSSMIWGVSAVVLLTYAIALIASYLIAVFCRKFLPLVIVAFFDVFFSASLIIWMVCIGRFYSFYAFMIVSLFVNLGFSIYFLSVWKYLKWERKRLENS